MPCHTPLCLSSIRVVFPPDSAAAINLSGDVLLVSWLGRGLAGAAWATSVSQGCAALLLLRTLAKRRLIKLRFGSARAPRKEGGWEDVVREGEGQVESKVEGGSVERGPVERGQVERGQGEGVAAQGAMVEIIRSILSFIPFLFVMFVKVGLSPLVPV